MVRDIVGLINGVLNLILLVIFVQAILSWLVAFDVIKTRNRNFWQLMDVLDRLTTPLLRPFRRFVPLLGGVDVSPLLLLLSIRLIQIILNRLPGYF